MSSGREENQSHFAAGLRALGYDVHDKPFDPQSGDLILTWNRIGYRHHQATVFERAGLPVIVVENGYCGKPKDGGKFYAMALQHHNGRGLWRVGSESRLAKMALDIKPWRDKGTHVLVLPSRGLGEPGIAQPKDWPSRIVHELKAKTQRPIRVRPHPGNKKTALEPDLVDCHAIVTWSSGAAIKGLAAGIPVFYCLKNWIACDAALFGTEFLETPLLGDRLPMFERLAWAQWSANEIATGEPIKWLLGSLSTQ